MLSSLLLPSSIIKSTSTRRNSTTELRCSRTTNSSSNKWTKDLGRRRQKMEFSSKWTTSEILPSKNSKGITYRQKYLKIERSLNSTSTMLRTISWMWTTWNSRCKWTGKNKAMLLQWKTRGIVDHAGPSLPLLPLKVWKALTTKPTTICLSSNLSTVPTTMKSRISDAMEDGSKTPTSTLLSMAWWTRLTTLTSVKINSVITPRKK